MENETPTTPSPVNERNPTDSAPQSTFLSMLAALDLDEETARVVTEAHNALTEGNLSENLVKLLAAGVTRDDDVKTAEAAGYIRGKNEQIEAMTASQLLPAENTDDTAEPAEPDYAFPRYNRRSIWDW